MLKGVIIEDFQAHTYRKIIFSNGVNTIIGPTDKGKSAIIRALRWCLLNEPSGKEFIRDGAKLAKVSVRCSKTTIIRERGKSDNNLYHMGDQDYKAFGNGVPDAITDLLKVSKVNFQGQFDSPFWFSLPAPEVSRQLNQIINLGVIDTTMSKIASSVLSHQSEVTTSKGRLEKVKVQYQELKYLQELDDELKTVEALKSKMTEAKEEADDFTNLLQEIKDLKKASQKASQKADDFAIVLKAAKSYRLASKEYKSLSDDIEAIQDTSQRITKVPDFSKVEKTFKTASKCLSEYTGLKNLLERLEGASGRLISVPVFSDVSASFEKMHGINRDITKFDDLLERVKIAAEYVEDCQEELNIKKEAFHESIKGEECPLCGNQM